jgi:hypothetical protein
MSDHVWLSSDRAALLAESFLLHSREVEQMAGQLPGDRYEGQRSQALAIAGALSVLAEEIREGQAPMPVQGERRREVGENTRRGLQRLAGNRGTR